MRRKQMYVDDEIEAGLKRLTARTGRPEAEHIRAALRAYLAERLPKPEADPLEELIGLVDEPGGPDDVAEDHDRYLYGSA